MDKRLLDILACPVCKGPLVHLREEAVLVCRADRLAFLDALAAHDVVAVEPPRMHVQMAKAHSFARGVDHQKKLKVHYQRPPLILPEM